MGREVGQWIRARGKGVVAGLARPAHHGSSGVCSSPRLPPAPWWASLPGSSRPLPAEHPPPPGHSRKASLTNLALVVQVKLHVLLWKSQSGSGISLEAGLSPQGLGDFLLCDWLGAPEPAPSSSPPRHFLWRKSSTCLHPSPPSPMGAMEKGAQGATVTLCRGRQLLPPASPAVQAGCIRIGCKVTRIDFWPWRCRFRGFGKDGAGAGLACFQSVSVILMAARCGNRRFKEFLWSEPFGVLWAPVRICCSAGRKAHGPAPDHKV